MLWLNMKFENTRNNYIEDVSSPLSWFWVFLFGPLYWAVKGIWRHAIAHIVLIIITFGIAHIIYPFFSYSIIKKHYLKMGWKQIK
jgi:hypothetical protein